MAGSMSDLERARGYFDLGMFEDAWLAVEAMPLGRLNDADVLLLRFEILAALERWDFIEAMSKAVARMHPYEERLVELAAEAVERTKGNQARIDFMDDLKQDVADSALELYERGCREAQRGDLKRAGEFLRAAFARDMELRKRALDEPDLKTWWDAM